MYVPKYMFSLAKALEIGRSIGAWHDVALLSFNAAKLALAMGDRMQAKQYAQESLRLYEQLKLEKNAAKVRAWMEENGL